MRTIDADELKKELAKSINYIFEQKNSNAMYYALTQIIDEQPTVHQQKVKKEEKMDWANWIP